MKTQVAIGIQDFEKIRRDNVFYVDKTSFITEWWDRKDEVTLITRPRRFGKTLNMSMLNYFFSNKHPGRGDLFEGLSVWEREDYHALQGTYPVIFLSFAGVKNNNYADTLTIIKKQLEICFSEFPELKDSEKLSENEKKQYASVTEHMSNSDAEMSLNLLSRLLYKHYGKKVLILLDEYDTPMQEAYVSGYWDELTSFFRSLFNNALITNPSLERAMMTGITRVSKESIFSDLNNLNVVTTTSDEYADCFGFSEKEVFAAMDELEIPGEEKQKVKAWYDGFTFGSRIDIYNPWSVIMYLDKRQLAPYWANTSGNGLISHLLRKGDNSIKSVFEDLLTGKKLVTTIDEQIIFSQLDNDINAVWSLLVASGYLKVEKRIIYGDGRDDEYTLSITNLETDKMFRKMISDWFSGNRNMNRFVKAMLTGNVYEMNAYMNDIALTTFSSFDAGNKPGVKAPENFYHGFVLGLMVDNAADYIVKSNRESGYGRYDVVMEPRDGTKPAVIMEFKVYAKDAGEKDLSDTVESALKQIEDKKYEIELLAAGIPAENILKYGFAFQGKQCMIRKG